MRSAIPNIGLVHRVDVVRFPDLDDGAGGIKRGTPVVIVPALPCRIGMQTGEDIPKGFGWGRGQHWLVMTAYSALVKEEDCLVLSATCIACRWIPGVYYRVTSVFAAEDHRGGLHHLSLTCHADPPNV